MAYTRKNQTFDGNGTILHEDLVPVSDAEEFEEQAAGRLIQAAQLLRQWETDAQTAAAGYDAMTAAQKQAVQKTVIQRFGKLCGALDDLLMYLRADR